VGRQGELALLVANLYATALLEGCELGSVSRTHALGTSHLPNIASEAVTVRALIPVCDGSCPLREGFAPLA
jgi:hypothetical protein